MEPSPGGALSPTAARHISGPADPTPFKTAARLAMPDPTEGMLFESTLPTGHTVRVDVSPEFGGHSLAPEPKQLLLVSLGACTGLDVISILRKKRQDVTHYSINVLATEATEHPRIYTSILVEHVVGGHSIDPRAVERSIELSITKYCPVHALLSKVIPIEHVYRVLEEV
jgi:putative redox protein